MGFEEKFMKNRGFANKMIIILIVTLVSFVSMPKISCHAATVSGVGNVTVDSLNVRSEADSESDVLGKVAGGDSVTIVGEESGWYEIDYQGQKGYVAQKYVDATLTEDDADAETESVSSTTDEEKEESEGSLLENYKTFLILFAVVVVLLLIIVITFKSIKRLDEEDDDDEYDYEEDDYDEDEDYDEVEYEPVRRSKPVQKQKQYREPAPKEAPRRQTPKREEPVRRKRESYDEDAERFNRIRREPASDPVRYMSNNPDDYRIDIDPSFFEATGTLPNLAGYDDYDAPKPISSEASAKAKKDADIAEAMRKMEELQKEIERLKNSN